MKLSNFEDDLSGAWTDCADGREKGFHTTTAFYRGIQVAAKEFNAELILMDVGPNLGALNRSAVIAADYVIIPLAPDLFSLQGLRNLGPTLKCWREQWKVRLGMPRNFNIPLPSAAIEPAGFILMQHAMRESRPIKAYEKWARKIPAVYREFILPNSIDQALLVPELAEDPYRLANIKHYRSLMPMAMTVRKPIFALKPADGAIGSHVELVMNCRKDFYDLTNKIAERCGICIPVERIPMF